MVMSRHQIARQNQNITRGNKSFEKLDQFRCLGITITFQIPFMTTYMKSRLKSGNACYHSVPNCRATCNARAGCLGAPKPSKYHLLKNGASTELANEKYVFLSFGSIISKFYYNVSSPE